MIEDTNSHEKIVPTSAQSEESGSNDALKELGSQFSDPGLKSSTRVLIIFALALNRKLSFSDLLSLTGTGKGSLSNHIEKLEASGYIRTRSVMSFGGPRISVDITEKGMESYESLVKSLKKLGR